jgi:hypothetical protein
LGIDGASHVDLYDKDEYVPTAIAKLADFFTTDLIGAKPEARMRSYNSGNLVEGATFSFLISASIVRICSHF